MEIIINTAPERKVKRRGSTPTYPPKKRAFKVLRYKRSLGIITREDFVNMSADCEAPAGRIKRAASKLKAELTKTENGVDPFLATFHMHENIDALTREVLIELADHIKIHEGAILL
ncbi:MAG: DUF4368 domain-containing protein [Clostridiales bacterium]|nr:DUF4368 domain-containing protein [Clostridiales bacterium]